MNNIDLGLRIRQCRKAKKMTREQLAEKVDISSHYLYEIERGSKSVSVSILSDLAQELQTSLDYLVFGALPTQYDYIITDELNELLLDLNTGQRHSLYHIVKSLLPYLKL